tara:strand:+ start:3139 stop:3333 length:195 start_codon:yes stop_codon:yes gene_type:complete
MRLTKHLRDNNVTWVAHCKRAIIWAWSLQKIALILLIHSIFPWTFENYASSKIGKIYKEMNSEI